MERTVAELTGLGEDLASSIFADRSAQFVGRLGWDLCVNADGHETDEYDAEGTTYLVVHRGARHLGSCRVRAVSRGTMLLDHFRAVFPLAEAFLSGQGRKVWELTRFCRAPGATASEARQMLAEMAEMLDEFRDRHRLTGFVAVVYPEVGRFLESIGVRYLRLAVSEIDGREAHLICITHCVRPAPATATPRLREGSRERDAVREPVAAADAKVLCAA